MSLDHAVADGLVGADQQLFLDAEDRGRAGQVLGTQLAQERLIGIEDQRQLVLQDLRVAVRAGHEHEMELEEARGAVGRTQIHHHFGHVDESFLPRARRAAMRAGHGAAVAFRSPWPASAGSLGPCPCPERSRKALPPPPPSSSTAAAAPMMISFFFDLGFATTGAATFSSTISADMP
jgi:hypothetical protein